MAIQHASFDAGTRARPPRGRELGTSDNDAGAGAVEWLAQGLGWLSIGLGLAELLTPRGVARVSGVPNRSTLLRGFGAREVASGVAILAQRRPTTAVWSRVVGDVVDLAALAGALTSQRSRRGRVLAATAAVAGVTALDVLCGRMLSRTGGGATRDAADGVRLRTAITIQRSAEDVYRFWRNFSNLPRVMRHLVSVTPRGERRSHWIVEAPGGMRAEWDAEIVDDRPNELITWRSLPGGDVQTDGAVRFVAAPAGRGTEVHLDMRYRTVAGIVAAGVGALFGGAASTFVAQDLRPLKQLLETGEIPTTNGSPTGGRA